MDRKYEIKEMKDELNRVKSFIEGPLSVAVSEGIHVISMNDSVSKWDEMYASLNRVIDFLDKLETEEL